MLCVLSAFVCDADSLFSKRKCFILLPRKTFPKKLRSAFRLPVQIFHRLHLLVCFFTTTASALPILQFPTHLPCRNQVSPISSTPEDSNLSVSASDTLTTRRALRLDVLVVELGGIEPPSRTPFNNLQRILRFSF